MERNHFYIIDFLYLERQYAQLIKNFHVYNKYVFFNIMDLCYMIHIVRLNIYIELILLLVLFNVQNFTIRKLFRKFVQLYNFSCSADKTTFYS